MITLGQACAQAVVAAPLATIDLGTWMFTLTSEEYAACAVGHQSAAQGVLPSGKRVSMNVEVVGGNFMVQHYIETIARRDHVRGVSPNTVLWVDDEHFVLARITWDLRVERVDDATSQLTCTVTAETEDEGFAARVEALNRDTPVEERAFQRHIDEETPLFARDIQRKALAGVWGTVEDAGPFVEMLERLYNHGDPRLLREMVAPDVRHYSSAIGDGVEAWAAFARRFEGRGPIVEVHRTVSEGNRVGVHAAYRWNAERELDDGPGVAVAHIFTLEEGLIVEAVELTQAVREETVSGNDMFSQLTPSVEPQDPARNRAVARRVVTEFLEGDTALKDELLSDYIQHNPAIPPGADGIAGFIDMLGGNPNDFQWSMAQGDLAWTYTRYNTDKLGLPPLVTVDIWRFDREGKVTEHWDVLEADFTSPSGHRFPGPAR